MIYSLIWFILTFITYNVKLEVISAKGKYMPLEGLQLGRYRLASLLGSGGMGEVYTAEDTHIHRQVALKVIRADAAAYPDAEAAKDLERLFQREVKAIASLDHPNILPLFDYGEEQIHNNIYIYMVMPLRRDGSLAQWLKQHATLTLPPQAAMHFIQQAAAALQYAHRHQIIHQDVKPANFLILPNEERPDLPDLQLADFGIAKFHTVTASMSQTSRGTPAFMAPEQWSGQPVPATDQYALAVMAYQLLTGQMPFQGRMEQIMYHHLNTAPLAPVKHNPTLPLAVDNVLLRALAKQPKERFPSIMEFARALQQALQPPPAPKITATSAPEPDVEAKATLPPMRRELRSTLTISEDEALQGTTRTLTLPGGQKKVITIPPHTADGQILPVGYQNSDNNAEILTLLVTIAIAPIKRTNTELPAIANAQGDKQRQASTILPKTELAQAHDLRQTPDILPGNAKHPPNKFFATNKKRIISIGSVALTVILLGGLCVFYFRYYNYFQRQGLLQANIASPDPSHPGTLAINDPLKDNSDGYFWYEGNSAGGSCAFTGGAYYVKTSQSNLVHECLRDAHFSNFIFQVQMNIIHGDYGGITFRSDSTNDQSYCFRVNNNGNYDITISKNYSSTQSLASGTDTDSSFISIPNQPITIAIVADGSTLTPYIDGKAFPSVNDSTYSQGYVGFAADDEGNPTEVAFTNARLWTF
jgi:serine/threonine protein kinase